MTRSTMRARTRRLLQEVTPDLWSDTDVNELLNTAASLVQKEVLKIDRMAFARWEQRPLVKDQNFYSKPEFLWFFHEVAIKNTSAAGGYEALIRKDYNIARDITRGDPVYTQIGEFLGIFPAPTATLTAGLQLLWCPTLAMAVDTDVLPLHPALHEAVVRWAQKLGMGDTDDPEAKVDATLHTLLADIPMYYQANPDNETFWLDMPAIY